MDRFWDKENWGWPATVALEFPNPSPCSPALNYNQGIMRSPRISRLKLEKI